MFATLLNPIFGPLLKLSPFLVILLLSLFITVLTTLIYRKVTDQKRMKELKAKTKEYQEKMKKQKDNPEKVLKLQKEAMGYQTELMKHSFKPMLYTLLPLLIIFGWMNTHLVYHELAPDEAFILNAQFSDGVDEATLTVIPEGVTVDEAVKTVEDGVATWSLKGGTGTYEATVSTGGGEAQHPFLISDKWEYLQPERRHDGAVAATVFSNERVRPLDPLTIFGWHPGWLATYIIFSMVLSIGMRKALNVV